MPPAVGERFLCLTVTTDREFAINVNVREHSMLPEINVRRRESTAVRNRGFASNFCNPDQNCPTSNARIVIPSMATTTNLLGLLSTSHTKTSGRYRFIRESCNPIDESTLTAWPSPISCWLTKSDSGDVAGWSKFKTVPGAHWSRSLSFRDFLQTRIDT
jgi:hypothetical protein